MLVELIPFVLAAIAVVALPWLILLAADERAEALMDEHIRDLPHKTTAAPPPKWRWAIEELEDGQWQWSICDPDLFSYALYSPGRHYLLDGTDNLYHRSGVVSTYEKARRKVIENLADVTSDVPRVPPAKKNRSVKG